ncbi:hypothetical protein NONO_c57580 [Nocardia nova SH22a]|uniref:Uncharacterized protein n=1 Tax=Nocardia nova SH22a TaxID=1415166 RepID=W5TTL4_9NOCA|nr:hypothetical protein [Nocardia nova]AHH20536.1 hypothetical protein NONO_c57580 [Nocardia nova SH22a]
MSGKLTTATPDVLVEEIIDRYGSIAQFCDLLRLDLDDPTIELPRIPMGPRSQQRWPQPPPPVAASFSSTEPGPPDAPPTEDGSAVGEANRRRGFWRRFIAWWRP